MHRYRTKKHRLGLPFLSPSSPIPPKNNSASRAPRCPRALADRIYIETTESNPSSSTSGGPSSPMGPGSARVSGSTTPRTPAFASAKGTSSLRHQRDGTRNTLEPVNSGPPSWALMKARRPASPTAPEETPSPPGPPPILLGPLEGFADLCFPKEGCESADSACQGIGTGTESQKESFPRRRRERTSYRDIH